MEGIGIDKDRSGGDRYGRSGIFSIGFYPIFMANIFSINTMQCIVHFIHHIRYVS